MNSRDVPNHLVEVDWSTLEHAYGDAGDVPGWIERLTDAETVEESLHQLWAAVLHQGTLYDSTPPAMTSIASLLGAGESADAENTAWLLLMFADVVNEYEQVELVDDDTAAVVRSARESLPRIAAHVRSLISGDGPEAAAAALLQATARPADSAAVGTLTARAGARPAGQVEQACVAALTTLGVDVPAALADGDPGLAMAATLARIAAGGTDTADLDALTAGWELAVEVAPLIAFGVANLPEWLSDANPEAAAHVLAALPAPDEATIAGLVDVVLSSRGSAPAAIRRLLALAALPEAEPEVMIAALRQCPATPELRDALVALAEKVTAGATSAVGSSTFDTDARADAGFALLQAGDGRWTRPMAQALLSNPAARGLMVSTSASGRSALGYALLREHAPSATMLVAGIRQALRQDPPADPSRDGAGHLVELLASWPADATASALPEIRDLLAAEPKQAAAALAAWHDTTSIDRIREVSACDVSVLLALARLTNDPDDFHRVLGADLQYRESDVLAHWADRTDPRFLDWCLSLVGTEPATADYQREDQVTALRILAAADSRQAESGWTVLRAAIDAGRGPVAEAIGLALEWRAQQLLPPHVCTDLESLLTDLVLTDRRDYNGPMAKTSAVAAIALLDIGLALPGTPARIVKVVTRAVTDRHARAQGLALAERLTAATEPVRNAVAAALRSLVDRDERFDCSGDVAVEDERSLARLRPILDKLETA
ncbi:hypothetical protein [Rhodococcus gannanensis]|uniref:HEAT repeat domain-containing protein n=1 Tax=Rhodococcus gannanensis TaxID=1960308 RepID=A0ABW4P223_9NOCA